MHASAPHKLHIVARLHRASLGQICSSRGRYYGNQGTVTQPGGCLNTLPITAAAAPLCLSPRRLRVCRQALESFSPRQLRLMFVLQPWEKKMNYGEQVSLAVWPVGWLVG